MPIPPENRALDNRYFTVPTWQHEIDHTGSEIYLLRKVYAVKWDRWSARCVDDSGLKREILSEVGGPTVAGCRHCFL